MGEIAIRGAEVPFDVRLGGAGRWGDEELFELCSRNPDLRIERTAEGNVVVMTPAGWESSHRNLEIALALGAWAKRDGTGVASDSSGGFLLPNGAMRSPDAAWVLRSRLAEVPPEARRRFLPLCPDFVVELRSPSDSLAELQTKMDEYRANGARLGWLIDPEEQRIYVYRPDRPVEVLDHPTEISGDPELPGFILDLSSIWETV